MECMNALRCSAFALIIAGLSAGPAAIAQPAHAMIETDPALDLLLTREAQRMLDAHQFRTSRSTQVVVNASVDLERQRLIIRFGPGMLPAEDDHSLEEIEQYIRSSLEFYALRSGAGEVQSEVLYEGKPYWEHFPIMPAAPAQSSDASTVNSVLVSASHGLVRVHPGLEWEFQRPARNGVQEDLITVGYAEELQQLMEERGGRVVHRARRNQGDLHPESERAWSEMSSRYHLRDLLPDRPDIWNHFANSTATDREVSDDIRARPYYANHLGAAGLFSIHTNADASGAARGTRVYYHPRKPSDQRLADMVLCYMRELITAQEEYADFPVAAAGAAASHGENGFAQMPSVVVEVAFHTNPTDAAALLDPAFRTASMKGVEKGYRLFREGEGCVPLKVEPIQSIELSAGNSRRVDIVFEGHPRYPIDLVTTNVGCPPGWTCTDGKVHIAAPDEKPSQIIMRCENAGSAPLFWNTQVVDADGVKSPPVRHRVQCIRRPGGLSVAATGLAGS